MTVLYGFDSKYRHYELGYDEIMKETDKFIRYGGVSLSYTDMDNGYNQGQGDSDGYATNFYVTQMGNKGHYLDVVFKVQHIDSDFTACTIKMAAELQVILKIPAFR